MAEKTPSKDAILKDYPRLTSDDSFTFHCGKDLDCFTDCCRDISIVLTPYDVLRMKNALKMDSTEFLEKYTLSSVTKEKGIPVVLLNMDGEGKRCPLVGEDGCTVYHDRPWSCRMYPLGSAEPKNPSQSRFYNVYLMKEEFCHGHGEGKTFTVREWLMDQGIEDYEMMGQSFKNLMLHDFWESGESLTPEQIEMYYMGCYDIDKFRRFVFESRFLELFEVDEDRAEAMRKKDDYLLDFAMQWLAFSLFKEKTMKIKKSVQDEKLREKAEKDESAASKEVGRSE